MLEGKNTIAGTKGFICTTSLSNVVSLATVHDEHITRGGQAAPTAGAIRATLCRLVSAVSGKCTRGWKEVATIQRDSSLLTPTCTEVVGAMLLQLLSAAVVDVAAPAPRYIACGLLQCECYRRHRHV
jgi:hypothetical protein